jgi:hypothetical protein
MICPYCGKENPEDVDTCIFCGGPLAATLDEPQKADQLEKESPAEVNETQPAAEGPTSEADPTSQPQQGEQVPLIQPAPPQKAGIYGARIWWIAGCGIFVCLVVGCIVIVLGAYRYVKSTGFLDIATTAPLSTPILVQVSPSLPAVSTPGGLDANPTSTAPSSEGQAILFFDDFSDTSSGWDQVEEADYSTDYYNHTYRILVNTNMSDSWANPSGWNFNDAIYEVDAIKNGGSDDNDFGLICRYQDPNHFYYAVISSDGYYAISKVTADSTQILGSENLEYSDFINQGSASNHLRFDCISNRLTLFVNGHLLDQQTDSEYSSGNVGLIAGTYDSPGTDILFDNLRVTSP